MNADRPALTPHAGPTHMEATLHTVIKRPPTHGFDPSTDDLDGWVVTEGNPSMKTWVQHTSAVGDMAAGIWECSKGSYHATCTTYEYVVLISGRVALTPDGEEPVTVKAGDTFVVEPTFKGIWRIEEDVRKQFDFRFK